MEEYDPLQPLVSIPLPEPAPGTEDDVAMDTSESRNDEPYDPIVSAYTLADSHTLNAEDAPGTSACAQRACMSHVTLSVMLCIGVWNSSGWCAVMLSGISLGYFAWR